MAMRHGASLVELLLVVVIVGVVTGVALPQLTFLRDRLLVEQEAAAFSDAVRFARTEALRRNQIVELVASADSLRLLATVPDTVRLWFRPGPAQAGVALSAPVTPVRIAPSGLALGPANGTWRFSRGAAARRVILSRYGRIRILP